MASILGLVELLFILGLALVWGAYEVWSVRGGGRGTDPSEHRKAR